MMFFLCEIFEASVTESLFYVPGISRCDIDAMVNNTVNCNIKIISIIN